MTGFENSRSDQTINFSSMHLEDQVKSRAISALTVYVAYSTRRWLPSSKQYAIHIPFFYQDANTVTTE